MVLVTGLNLGLWDIWSWGRGINFNVIAGVDLGMFVYVIGIPSGNHFTLQVEMNMISTCI